MCWYDAASLNNALLRRRAANSTIKKLCKVLIRPPIKKSKIHIIQAAAKDIQVSYNNQPSCMHMQTHHIYLHMSFHNNITTLYTSHVYTSNNVIKPMHQRAPNGHLYI